MQLYHHCVVVHCTQQDLDSAAVPVSRACSPSVEVGPSPACSDEASPAQESAVESLTKLALILKGVRFSGPLTGIRDKPAFSSVVQDILAIVEDDLEHWEHKEFVLARKVGMLVPWKTSI